MQVSPEKTSLSVASYFSDKTDVFSFSSRRCSPNFSAHLNTPAFYPSRHFSSSKYREYVQRSCNPRKIFRSPHNFEVSRHRNSLQRPTTRIHSTQILEFYSRSIPTTTRQWWVASQKNCLILNFCPFIQFFFINHEKWHFRARYTEKVR